MREILFRGKTLSGKWVEGFFLIRKERYKGDKTFMSEETIISSGICESSGAYAERTEVLEDEVIPETVGQFTDLTDKNGKKIFEGDVVRATVSYNDRFRDRVDSRTNIYEVKYHEKYCYFHLARKQNNLLFDGNWSYYLKEIEVIGNIHDNPELLGGDSNER